MKEHQQTQPKHEAIAIRAFQLWAQDGEPLGQSERHWLLAEAELKHGVGQTSTPVPVGSRAKRALQAT